MNVRLSVYSHDGPRPEFHNFTALGNFNLRPKTAIMVLDALNIQSGMVYQDNIMRNGQLGTLAYRVYASGRTRRFWWAYLPVMTETDYQRLNKLVKTAVGS